MSKSKPKTGIEKAVEVAGGVRALARLVGLSKSHVHRMVDRGVVPAIRCHLFEEKTGIPLNELNPVIYKKAA